MGYTRKRLLGRNAAFLLTIGSFLLAVELPCRTLLTVVFFVSLPFLLTVGALLLTVGALLLTVGECV